MQTKPPSSQAPRQDTVRFSEELRILVARFDGRPVRVGEFLQATQGRGSHLLLLLIALPFVGPIPLPGFSIPFGLVISILGLRLMLDRAPWFPKRLLQRELSAPAVYRAADVTSRILRAMERLVRPRWGFVTGHVVFTRIAGGLIVLSGAMMMLPFPLPFSNSLPAWTVILLSLGALGRDGLFFFAGCAAFLVSLAFFGVVLFGGVEALEFLHRILNG